MAPPPEECLQLLSRATQVFREQYLLKQDLAKEELQRRCRPGAAVEAGEGHGLASDSTFLFLKGQIVM